ncbi:MHS family MFS transporter [Yaniella flava]|uniref:MHS family MFS transporter n=1 Tax=Yaniella flava TaxID=287930 RepID=A0ABN2UP55_9MICC
MGQISSQVANTAQHTPENTKPSMAKVATATTIGTTIEYYDFFVYGTAAALVFPVVFFPALGAAAGLTASFATFAVAFFARPVGAMVFGHYGDRLGRKRALVATLIIMGVATVGIGLLPTPEMLGTFGWLAPTLLVAMRFFQGFAVGGEWAGAALMAAEYAPPKLRGFFASLPMLGPSIAFGLSSTTFLITNITLGEESEAFLTYGWRIPFVLSAVLVIIGLWIRMSLDETPVFREQQAKKKAAEAQAAENNMVPAKEALPLGDAFRKQWKEIFGGGLAFAALFAFFYIGTSFLTSYGTTNLSLGRNEVLIAGIVASFFFAFTTVISGFISDRIGRKRTLVIAAIGGVIWSAVMFPVMNIGTSDDGTGSIFWFTLGVGMTLGVAGLSFGTAGSFLPELFETQYRYTGAGTAYGFAGVFGGAIPPLLAASLIAAFGEGAVGLMLTLVALISALVLFTLRETKGGAMDETVPDDTNVTVTSAQPVN